MSNTSNDPEVRAAAVAFRGPGWSASFTTSAVTALITAVTTWLVKPDPPAPSPDWAKLDRGVESLRVEVVALREAIGQDRSRAITEAVLQAERDRAQDARLARLER